MAYDTPVRHVYTFAANSFASADRAIVLKNPRKGARGKLMSVEAMVTTTCAGATTKPIIKVGTTVGGAELASVNLGTAAAGEVVSSRENKTVVLTAAAGTVTSTTVTNATGIIGLASGAHVRGATDADLYVTLVAATGAGAAGVADVKIEVEWQ
jgi:hypothetical protein